MCSILFNFGAFKTLVLFVSFMQVEFCFLPGTNMKASDISIVVEHLTTDHDISGSNPSNSCSTSTEVVIKNKNKQNNIKARFFSKQCKWWLLWPIP